MGMMPPDASGHGLKQAPPKQHVLFCDPFLEFPSTMFSAGRLLLKPVGTLITPVGIPLKIPLGKPFGNTFNRLLGNLFGSVGNPFGKVKEMPPM